MKKSLLVSGLLFAGAFLLFSCSDEATTSGSGDNPKAAESNADLLRLVVNEGTLQPEFHPDSTEYSVIVLNEVNSIVINGVADHHKATLSKESGTEQKLSVGENLIAIVVTAPDGKTEKRYLITVTRLKEGEELPKESSSSGSDKKNNGTSSSSTTGSQNGENSSSSQTGGDSSSEIEDDPGEGVLSTHALLSALQVDYGWLVPSFNPVITDYDLYSRSGYAQDTLGVRASQPTITVTGTKGDSKSTISTNNGVAQNLKTGVNTISITVTGEDGHSKSVYRIRVVKHHALSNEARLSSLSPSAGSLSFSRDTQSYSLSVPYATNKITLTASSIDPKAALSGDVGVAKNLQVGDNSFSITVTAEDGAKKTYTVQVRRRISVVLTGLTVSAGSLNPSFHTDSTSYQASVNSRQLTITATPQFPAASIVLERMTSWGSVLESFANSSSMKLPLPVGSVTIRVKVTGEGSDQKNYVLLLYPSGFAEGYCAVAGNCGTFTDFRNSKTYKWTKIGTQIWMAENLNYGTRVAGTANQKDASATGSDGANKYCYADTESNCNTYGGLYQWHSAMALPYSCNSTAGCTVNTPHQGICPTGWHLPTQAEWATFDAWVDNDNDGAVNDNEGISLRSTAGWYNNGNGTDGYGWTGLPGGNRYDGSFYGQGYYGSWWSASEGDANLAWNRYLVSGYDGLGENYGNKYSSGFSVRCLRDTSW